MKLKETEIDQSLSRALCQEMRQVAERAVKEAGQLIIQEGYRRGGPRGSGDKAEVDKEIERLIHQMITQRFPAHGITVEEDRSLNRSPKTGEKLHWYLDPNDGTRSFLRGFRGSAISLGLLYAGEPIFGVVYAPTYPNDQGDFISGGHEPLFGQMRRNDQVVRLKDRRDMEPKRSIIAVSQDADTRTSENIHCSISGHFIAVPSIAYRLALVALGDADAGVSLAKPTHYDCAASHALLRAAGCELYGAQGQVFRYHGVNQGPIIGGDPSLCESLYERPWSSLRRAPKIKDKLPFGLSRPTWSLRLPAEHQDSLSLAQGALIGMLIGGAVGVTTRSMPAQTSMSFGQVDLKSLSCGAPPPLVEQALLLARSIVRAGRYDPKRALQSYLRWATHHGGLELSTYASPNIDITTLRALRAAQSSLDAGDSMEQVMKKISRHKQARSHSNTGLLRAVIIGVYGFRLPDKELMSIARLDARLTHPSKLSQDAHALVALQVATYLRIIGEHRASLRMEEGWSMKPRAHDWLEEQVPKLSICQELKDAVAYRDQFSQFVSSEWLIDTIKMIYNMNMWFRRYEGDSPYLFKGYLSQISMIGHHADLILPILGATMGATVGVEHVPTHLKSHVLSTRQGWDPSSATGPRWAWGVDVLNLTEQLMCAGLGMSLKTHGS